jgi:hypothetical protein
MSSENPMPGGHPPAHHLHYHSSLSAICEVDHVSADGSEVNRALATFADAGHVGHGLFGRFRHAAKGIRPDWLIARQQRLHSWLSCNLVFSDVSASENLSSSRENAPNSQIRPSNEGLFLLKSGGMFPV